MSSDRTGTSCAETAEASSVEPAEPSALGMPSAGAAPAAAASDVPAALLTLAKSARYATHLSELLSDLVGPYLESFLPANTADNNNGRNTNIAALKPELDLVASILHAVLVIWRTGRSMGNGRYWVEILFR